MVRCFPTRAPAPHSLPPSPLTVVEQQVVAVARAEGGEELPASLRVALESDGENSVRGDGVSHPVHLGGGEGDGGIGTGD